MSNQTPMFDEFDQRPGSAAAGGPASAPADDSGPTCLVCGKPLVPPATGGRTPKFCTPKHRAQYHRQQAQAGATAPARRGAPRTDGDEPRTNAPSINALQTDVTPTNAPRTPTPTALAGMNRPADSSAPSAPPAEAPASARPAALREQAEPRARTFPSDASARPTGTITTGSLTTGSLTTGAAPAVRPSFPAAAPAAAEPSMRVDPQPPAPSPAEPRMPDTIDEAGAEKLTELHDEVAELREGLARIRHELQQAYDDRRAVDQELKRLEDEFDLLDAERSATAIERDAAREQLLALTEDATGLRDQLARTRWALDRAESLPAPIDPAEYDRVVSELTLLSAEVQAERDDADRLYAELQSAHAELAAAGQALAAERSSAADLRAQVAAADEEARIERDDADRLYAELQPLRQEYARLESDHASALDALDALEDNRRAERTRAELLQTQIEAQRGLREQAEAERDRVMAELDRLLSKSTPWRD